MIKYKDTIDCMLSDDYRERFVAEYAQTKIRYDKLKRFTTEIEAAEASHGKNVEMPKLDCPEYILRNQQEAMERYLHMLEVRAVIEGIDLDEEAVRDCLLTSRKTAYIKAK